MRDPFRYFNTSPEIIRLAVMTYVRFPLSLGQVEDLLHERGIDLTRFRLTTPIPLLRLPHRLFDGLRFLVAS